MANFFEKAINMFNEGNKVFWIAFAFAEEARAFPPNPEIENLGIQIRILGELSDNLKLLKGGDKSTKNRIDTELKMAIHDYKEAFKRDPNRISANLEGVFSKVESYREKTSAIDQTYDRLQYVIAGLFNKLEKDLSEKFSDAAHYDLSGLIADSGEFKHTFISFNYDLWLEKALFKKGLWYPRDGHGNYRFQYYSPPLADVTTSKDFENGKFVIKDIYEPKEFRNNDKQSSVKVLKPHGSLSWRFGTKNPENGVVILEGGENSSVAYNSSWAFPASKFKDGIEMDMVPLVVPPAPNKIRSHPLFWETDKDVYNAMLQADIVVIVGWSMPLTDQYLKDTVLRALNNREEQIKKLIICDKEGTDKSLMPRLESIFRPRELRSFLEGFSKGFVDFLRKEL